MHRICIILSVLGVSIQKSEIEIYEYQLQDRYATAKYKSQLLISRTLELSTTGWNYGISFEDK